MNVFTLPTSIPSNSSSVLGISAITISDHIQAVLNMIISFLHNSMTFFASSKFNAYDDYINSLNGWILWWSADLSKGLYPSSSVLHPQYLAKLLSLS